MERREYVKWGRVFRGVAQTGFGISDMGEGIHDVYLGFKDVDDNKQQAVRISKKVLGKYEEPLNFVVGATTEQVIVIGQAFYRFPISNMTGNTNSSTKKESNSNVTTEKQKTNNTGTEKVVEDTTTVKTVSSNNKNTNNQQKVVLVDKNPKLKYAISIEKKADNGKKIKIYITLHLPYLMNIWWRMEL